MDALIDVECAHGWLGWLRLYRPENKHALSIQLCDEVADALDQLVDDREMRVVVAAGTGETFCAGCDHVELQRVGGPHAAPDRTSGWPDDAPTERPPNVTVLGQHTRGPRAELLLTTGGLDMRVPTTTHRSLALAAVLALLPLAHACGDDGDDRPVGPDAGVDLLDAGDGDPCPLLSLGVRELQLNPGSQLTGVRFPVTPNLDGALLDELFVELYDSTTPDLPPLEPGSFALDTAPNNDLATCQHCVWLPVDWNGAEPLATVFVATSGTLTLTEVTDPLEAVFSGSLADVVLREALLDDEGHTQLVEDGRCLRVPDTSFDTAPTPGRNCESAEDCGNPLLEVCSPATHRCVERECGEDYACPAGRPLCLRQFDAAPIGGACYADCDPAAGTGCADGETCLQLAVDPHYGYCVRIGAGELGEACETEDTSSSCVAGQLCSPLTQSCTRACSYFSDTPGCQSGSQCNVLGVCEPTEHAIDVDFGATCGDDAELAQGCAPDGEALRGICFSFRFEDPLVCEKACLGELGCAPEEFCGLRFTSGLGICLPDPICGDGLLGEIDEICDDGNTVSGDGCSSDCQTVEYEAICAALAPLAPESSVAGDTQTAWDGFMSICQAGIARAELYQFSPPSRGRLRLTMDSPTLQIMSLRTDCAELGTELSCRDNLGIFGAPELIYQVTDAATELTVQVSAFHVLEQGPFTLHAEFVAENCGDGVIAGLEVCDDGNTSSGDGCSGDCSAVEYDVYCDAATALTLATPLADDNSDGAFVYDASCSNEYFGSGPDKLFRYTATSSGTLRLRLSPEGADLALAVFDACGAPGSFTELGCSSVRDVEQVDVAVTTGQTLTILVEGFGPTDAGPFSLSAEMLP